MFSIDSDTGKDISDISLCPDEKEIETDSSCFNTTQKIIKTSYKTRSVNDGNLDNFLREALERQKCNELDLCENQIIQRGASILSQALNRSTVSRSKFYSF